MTRKVVSINGKDYYTLRDFANLVKLSYYTVDGLALYGNSRRKLRSYKASGGRLILKSELTDFPFVARGGDHDEYHFDEKGKRV
jgi:hypothetical protein